MRLMLGTSKETIRDEKPCASASLRLIKEVYML